MSNIVLERADLLQLEPISSRGTLKLLPLGKKNKQKLLIGDDSGQLSCYEFKKGEPQIVFQSKVFEGPITSIALGGDPKKRDKVFASHSQRIVGLTKKGKEFFKLTSSLTETIQIISVEDTRIWTGCENVYNLYDNGKDAAYFISRGQINDMHVSNLTRETDFDTILACQDKYIRIIRISQLYMEIPCTYAVTAVTQIRLDNEAISINKKPSYLVYGTARGTLGLVELSTFGTHEHIWELEDGELRSSITCIKIYDINKDNLGEIIIGREDGRVEIYKLQGENIRAEPVKIFAKDIGQSVRSIECGIVNTPDYPEVIVASYAGKVISFTTEPIKGRAQEDTYGRSIQTVNNENRIKSLKKEVDELRKKVEKERERVKKQSSGSSGTSAGSQWKSPIDFPVNSKFDLDTQLAAYTLNIELQMPMDLIILKSPVMLDLIQTDIGNSVLSVTPPQLQNGAGDDVNKYTAVFRCQAQESRISLVLRTNEGEFGDFVVTIVAAGTPKAAKVIKYELKPLSLHTKVHQLSPEELSRPRNRLKYTGNLSAGTCYEWIQSLFPDVPNRLDDEASEQKFLFRNTFTGAVTISEFRRNEIIVESESASTIAIAKENITRFANYRRVTLEESISPNEGSVSGFLSLIREKLEFQQSLLSKYQLVEAINEITQQESNPSWLSPEYQDILINQETIRREFKNRDKSLEYLSGIVTDLFVDWNRIQGQDARQKLPQLQNLVLNGDFEQLLLFFGASTTSSRK